ncbi:MAG TPA: FtsX-like permease family protein, partial [Ktedonobacteraceae bacterium]
VLVTLGSSPRPTLIYVPGVQAGQFGAAQAIAPLGWIEERWIAIGASILYLAQLGATRLLLITAVLAVCLGYLIVAFSALVAAQRREFAILSALGWRPWQPARLFLMQAVLLALGGGAVGVGLALLVATLLEAIPIWLIVTWTLPVMLVMALLSSLYPLWQIWRIQPAEILRTGSPVAARRASLDGLPFWSWVSPISTLVIRNLSRSRLRSVITIMSLFLSAILLVLMFSSILALRQTLVGTLLGDFVLLQTAVPQLAGCVFALLLTFLSVADLLLLQVRERQQEIGLFQAVGWRIGLIQRLFVQEGLILAIIGAIPGVLVAQWILVMQHAVQQIIATPLLLLGVVLLMMLVAALASIPALRAVNSMPIVDVLRAE